jgi:hypothetical protein
MTIGMYEERVGNYRLTKRHDGIITFRHFWKYHISTDGSISDVKVYHLYFNSETLEPLALTIDEHKEIPFFYLPFFKRIALTAKLVLTFERHIQGEKKGERVYSGFKLNFSKQPFHQQPKGATNERKRTFT